MNIIIIHYFPLLLLLFIISLFYYYYSLFLSFFPFFSFCFFFPFPWERRPPAPQNDAPCGILAQGLHAICSEKPSTYFKNKSCNLITLFGSKTAFRLGSCQIESRCGVELVWCFRTPNIFIYYYIAFPCRYRWRSGFSGPWKRETLTRRSANETADGTTWRTRMEHDRRA